MRAELFGFLAMLALAGWTLWQSLGADTATLQSQVESDTWADFQVSFAYTEGGERKTYQAAGGALRADFGNATRPARARGPLEAPPKAEPTPPNSADAPTTRARTIFTWQANVELEPVESLTWSLPPDPAVRELPIAAAEWIDPRHLGARRVDEDRAPVSFGPRPEAGAEEDFSMPDGFPPKGR